MQADGQIDPSTHAGQSPTPPASQTANPTAAPLPTVSPGLEIPRDYAGFWIRLLAAVIDGLIVVTPFFVIAILTGILDTDQEELFLYGVVIPVGLIYQIGMLVKFGATLGKMAVGVKVVDVSGEKLGFGKAVLREIIGKFVSSLIFDLGFIWVAFDEKKQGWHDKIAGTYVVKTR